jgi:hypothetical protein
MAKMGSRHLGSRPCHPASIAGSPLRRLERPHRLRLKQVNLHPRRRQSRRVNAVQWPFGVHQHSQILPLWKLYRLWRYPTPPLQPPFPMLVCSLLDGGLMVRHYGDGEGLGRGWTGYDVETRDKGYQRTNQ